ncbi:MAG: LicD family protein [Clostridia bacterium]|nr:LicD family protein [Clostridia bacterium]
MSENYLSFREMQLSCLDMLHAVDAICKKNRITYFLSGGTLLGAVRHKGFIPWDDDIDLMMPRGDLERFCKAAESVLPKRFRMAVPGRDKDHPFPWVRLYDTDITLEDSGMQHMRTEYLFMDIFPVDGMPNGKLAGDLSFKRIRFLDILLKCARKKKLYPDERLKWLKKPIMKIVSLKPVPFYSTWLYRSAARYDFSKKHYCGVYTVTHYGARERMPAEVFRGTVDVPFEDGMYPAPIGYDTYLSRLYGDYMKLPPEEKRVSLHNNHARRVEDKHV